MDRSAPTGNPVEKLAEGIPRLELERQTGISRTTLNRKIQNPEQFSLSEFMRLAEALGVEDPVALFVQVTNGGDL